MDHPPLDPCLATLDPATTEYFRRRPLLEQRLLWSLEIQGDRVTATTHSNAVHLPPKKKRGIVTHFSPKSRVRMLKRISEVQWESVKNGLFITLTYPDQRLPRDKNDRNDDLTRFVWYLENYLKVKVPIMWRCEWQVRKSGEYVGRRMPHWHLLCFRGRWMDHAKIMEWWQRIIEWPAWVDVWVEPMTSKKKVAVYVAKYSAKIDSPSSLDYVPYAKVDGLHWGMLRRRQIPWAPKTTFPVVPQAVVEKLRFIQAMQSRHHTTNIEQGFSFFGRRGECWKETIRAMCLDAGCRAC